jgi:hypothetical protein
MKTDIEELRPNLDLERKYVDFSSIRTAITVLSMVERLEIKVSEPNEEGERRGNCPKCDKPRSFSLNINTNRFNCFNKTCNLKGGGVIDFTSKLYGVTAKEASHLLACAYGIQPYTAEESGASQNGSSAGDRPESREVVEPAKPAAGESSAFAPIAEFKRLENDHGELKRRFERLSNIVFGYMLEHDETCHQEYEDEAAEHLVSH